MKGLAEKSLFFSVVTGTTEFESIEMLPVALCCCAAMPHLKGNNTAGLFTG